MSSRSDDFYEHIYQKVKANLDPPQSVIYLLSKGWWMLVGKQAFFWQPASLIAELDKKIADRRTQNPRYPIIKYGIMSWSGINWIEINQTQELIPVLIELPMDATLQIWLQFTPIFAESLILHVNKEMIK